MLVDTWQVFAWFEYATAVLKIFALIIFVVVAFALVLGAGPNGHVHHGETWDNGLAFRNGFKGYGNSVLLAILAVGDNSFTGFIAGEAVSPRYSVAHAVKLIPARVTGFYLVSMMFVGLLVPANSDRLLGGSGVAASPFVISIDQAGIKGLPDLLNVVIIFAVMSIGAESVYIASRIMRAMSHQQLIPRWIARVDSRGRPRRALAITLTVAIALTYCNLSAGGIEVCEYNTNKLSKAAKRLWLTFTSSQLARSDRHHWVFLRLDSRGHYQPAIPSSIESARRPAVPRKLCLEVRHVASASSLAFDLLQAVHRMLGLPRAVSDRR